MTIFAAPFNTVKMKKLAENPLLSFVSGIILTALVYFVSIFIGHHWHLSSSIVEDSVLNHGTMLILSIVLIIIFKKQVKYRIAVPKLGEIFKPILIGLLCAIVINVIMNIISVIVTGTVESHPLMQHTTVLKNFLSVFILASIAEEFLFRGFFQNYLKPLGAFGLKVFKRRISLPVLISALAFSAAHLVLIASGVGALFIVRVLIFTFVLGLIAGYYHEKHDNHIFAILVHMSGNLMGLVSVILMTMSF
jgi:membrane protease YdiL (CAAX protease family)